MNCLLKIKKKKKRLSKDEDIDKILKFLMVFY